MPHSPADAPAVRSHDTVQVDRVPEPSRGFTTLPDPRLSWSAPTRSLLVAIALWGNLVCQMGIIVTGGLVRLTKSGLGCTGVPHCEPDSFFPALNLDKGWHPFIEFGNRMLTLVLSVFALSVLIVTWRWLSHKGIGFMRLAWIPLIGTIVQALLGMAVVILDLHPGVVSPHFLISPILVAASTALVVRLYRGDDAGRASVPRQAHLIFLVLAGAAFAVLTLGTLVTGSGPHSGDSSDIQRFMFEVRTITMIHAVSTWVFLVLLLVMVVFVHRFSSYQPARKAAWVLVGVTVAQGVIGYTQYFLGLPELIVMLHMIGAAVFAAATAWLGAELMRWDAPAEEASTPTDSAAMPTVQTEAADMESAPSHVEQTA